MVKTLGALTGGALGAGIGEMVATMFLPGVGPTCRDKSYDQCRDDLRNRYPQMYESDPFLHGYERGQAYCRALQKRRGASGGRA